MSASTALSRATGFVRTWATAYALGVTALAASYSVANNIPNLIYELMAGGVMASAFIPVFLERLKQGGEEDAWRYASSIFNLTVIVLGTVSVLGIVFAEQVVRTQTFRVSPEEARLATSFFRFFSLQVVAYGSGTVISGLLNAHRRFLWPALSPIFNNIVVIVTLLVFYVPTYPKDPHLAFVFLATGTTLGVFTMVLVQVPSLLRTGVHYSPRIDLFHPGMRSVGRMALPMVLYVASVVAAVSFRNAFALESSPEGPATLVYAWMFYQLPYGIFAVALATAIFTELSESAGKKDWVSFKDRFAQGWRFTILLIVPMASMLIALSHPLISLYRAGMFTAEDVPAVAEILAIWAGGLLFFASYQYLLRTFYSLQDTRTPMIVNVVLTILLVFLYRLLTVGIGSWQGIGLKGIPVADGVFFLANFSVLAIILGRRIGNHDLPGLAWMLARIVLASVLGGVVAWMLARALPFSTTPWAALVQVLVGGSVGLGVTYSLAWVMRIREMKPAVAFARQTLTRLTSRRGVR